MSFTKEQLGVLEELPQRCWGVFREIVRQYIFDGAPVSSQAIAEINPDGLSSASIRKVMAQLEEAGLILQPHVSAGRVPTDLGYRCFVNRFVRSEQLAPRDLSAIDEGLGASQAVSATLDAASRLLSALSQQVGIVVSPYLQRMTLRNVEFVRISKSRVLAVFVSESGNIINRVVELESVPPQEELEKFARLLVDEFQGGTLPRMRELLQTRLSDESRQYNELTLSAMGLGLTALNDGKGDDSTEVYVEGKVNILTLPEISDLGKMRSLLQALEQKEKLIYLLDRCLDSGGAGALIGSEAGEEGLGDVAVLAATYSFRGQPLGSLAILGPTRMEYDRNLALVSHIAETLSDVLTEGSE